MVKKALYLFYLQELWGSLNSRADIIMLRSIRGVTPTGVYAVVTRVATLIVFILASVNMAPRLNYVLFLNLACNIGGNWNTYKKCNIKA